MRFIKHAAVPSMGSLLIVVCAAAAEESGSAAATVGYRLRKAGNVSLAVYDRDGVQVRTLLNAEPQAKGRHTAVWDGLDYHGRPALPGGYAWRLISSPPVQSEFLFYLGTNVGIEHWPCQHGGPKTVAVDGTTFVMGGTSEGSPVLTKATPGRKVLWHRSGFPAPEGLTDLAIDGGRLYALMSSSALERLEADTGRSVRRADGKGRYRFKLWLPVRTLGKIEPTSDRTRKGTPARTLDFEVPNGAYLVRFKARMAPECAGGRLHAKVKNKWFSFMDYGLKPGKTVEVVAPLAYRNHEPIRIRDGKLTIRLDYDNAPPDGRWAVDEIELLSPADRVDARDGAVAVLFSTAGTVGWVDPETGTLTERAEVPGARDLTVLDRDQILCAAGDRILRVRRGAPEPETVVRGLADAERLSFDASRQQLFVSCGGAHQQVLVFGRDFEPLARRGRAGGRRTGLYRAEDFLGVSDIAADGNGGFVVTEAESAPRRTAWFDTQGALIAEWYGGQQFYTFATPDPEDPTLVWMDSQWGWLMQAKVDYQRRTWKPRACYRWAERLDPLIFPTGKMTVRFFPFHADLAGNGQRRTYLWFQGSSLLLRVDEEQGLLHPVAHLGRMFPNQFWEWHRVRPEQFPTVYNQALAARKADPRDRNDVKGHLAYGWADANDDGQVQAEEMRLLPPSVHRNGHGYHGQGSVLWLDTATMDQIVYTTGKETAYFVRPIVGRTKQGYPMWSWNSHFDGTLRAGGASPYPFTGTRSGRLDDAGNLYLLMVGGGDGYAAGLDSFHSHGAGWPSTLASRTGAAKFDADGKLQWVVGNKAARADPLRGQIHHPVHVAGFAKGAVGICDYFRVPCHFWTEDGLFIGTLLDDRVRNGLPSRIYSWWRADEAKGDRYDNLAAFQYDMLVGGSLFELPGGDAIFMGAGWNNVPVFRVHGLDRLTRQSGTLALAAQAPHAAGKGKGLQAQYFPNDRWEGRPMLERTDPQVWFGSKKHQWPRHEVTARPFSARWQGMLEPRFGDEYRFALYSIGRARLWIGGRLLLDDARLAGDDRSRRQALNGREWKVFSGPVRLEAGRRIPVRVDWEGPKGKGEVHLCWESAAQQIEHIPSACLYPESDAGLPTVSLRALHPKVFRPGTGKGGKVEFILTRTGGLARLLTVRLDWSGSARPEVDYEPMPAQATFAARASEKRLPVRMKRIRRLAPTLDLICVVRPSADYVMDGTEGTAVLSLVDGRAARLEVARVRASSAWNAPWGKMNLHEDQLRRLVDGSGLDRAADPHTHDANIKNQWFAECAEGERTELTFDLGAPCDLADVHVWNANATSRHGGGWGDGNTVRHWVRKLRILASAQAAGPWQEVTTVSMRRPTGAAGEPGQRIPLGVRARYIRFRSVDRTEMHCVGLAEVEFYGVRSSGSADGARFKRQ